MLGHGFYFGWNLSTWQQKKWQFQLYKGYFWKKSYKVAKVLKEKNLIFHI
jgi:hypothetical protein